MTTVLYPVELLFVQASKAKEEAASLRGELTNAAAIDEKFEFTNNDMVLGVANYLNTQNFDEIAHIK